MNSQDLPQPDYAYNLEIIGHTDQGGRPDGVQLMVNKGFAITGHMFSDGFSVIDAVSYTHLTLPTILRV